MRAATDPRRPARSGQFRGQHTRVWLSMVSLTVPLTVPLRVPPKSPRRASRIPAGTPIMPGWTGAPIARQYLLSLPQKASADCWSQQVSWPPSSAHRWGIPSSRRSWISGCTPCSRLFTSCISAACPSVTSAWEFRKHPT